MAEATEVAPEVAEATEVAPEVAEATEVAIVKDPAMGPWLGWPGWEAPDETGPKTARIVAETGPEGTGSPDALTKGRRWVRGQVTAATGEPLAGALVTLVSADGDEAGHAIAGSDGSFAVGDMWEGTYTLIAAAPHFRPTANTFAVGAEEAPAALSLTGIGSLAGKVTTAKDGQPMSVDIELVSPDEGVSDQRRTGKDGSFLLSDVPEGSYELVARSAGYRTVEVPIVVERAETLTIGVAMVGLGHLYGALTGPGGEWMPGAQIALTDGTGTVAPNGHAYLELTMSGDVDSAERNYLDRWRRQLPLFPGPRGGLHRPCRSIRRRLLSSGGRSRFDRCRRRDPRLALSNR